MKTDKEQQHRKAEQLTIKFFGIDSVEANYLAKKCLVYFLYHHCNFSETLLARLFKTSSRSIRMHKTITHKHTLETYLNYMQNEH